MKPVRILNGLVKPLASSGLLVVLLVGFGCKHGTPSASELAKQYPGGRLPEDVQQELRAQMKPREYVAFQMEYGKAVGAVRNQAVATNGAYHASGKQPADSHRAWKPSTAAEFARNAKALAATASHDDLGLWRSGGASPAYTVSINANDAENLRLFLKITYRQGNGVVATTFNELAYDKGGFEGNAVFPLASTKDYDTVQVDAVLRTKDFSRHFTKSFALSEAKSDD